MRYVPLVSAEHHPSLPPCQLLRPASQVKRPTPEPSPAPRGTRSPERTIPPLPHWRVYRVVFTPLPALIPPFVARDNDGLTTSCMPQLFVDGVRLLGRRALHLLKGQAGKDFLPPRVFTINK